MAINLNGGPGLGSSIPSSGLAQDVSDITGRATESSLRSIQDTIDKVEQQKKERRAQWLADYAAIDDQIQQGDIHDRNYTDKSIEKARDWVKTMYDSGVNPNSVKFREEYRKRLADIKKANYISQQSGQFIRDIINNIQTDSYILPNKRKELRDKITNEFWSSTPEKRDFRKAQLAATDPSYFNTSKYLVDKIDAITKKSEDSYITQDGNTITPHQVEYNTDVQNFNPNNTSEPVTYKKNQYVIDNLLSDQNPPWQAAIQNQEDYYNQKYDKILSSPGDYNKDLVQEAKLWSESGDATKKSMTVQNMIEQHYQYKNSPLTPKLKSDFYDTGSGHKVADQKEIIQSDISALRTDPEKYASSVFDHFKKDASNTSRRFNGVRVGRDSRGAYVIPIWQNKENSIMESQFVDDVKFPTYPKWKVENPDGTKDQYNNEKINAFPKVYLNDDYSIQKLLISLYGYDIAPESKPSKKENDKRPKISY